MKKIMTLLFSIICSVAFSTLAFASDAEGGSSNVLTVVLIALGVAILAAIVCVVLVILKYKMKLQPTNYPLDKFAQLDITGSSDNLVTTNVTKVAIKTDSDSKR